MNIRFSGGLPEDNALCLRLVTLCLNQVAGKLNFTEGCRLSKLIGTKLTLWLYVDDLKVFASSESKLSRVLRSTRMG